MRRASIGGQLRNIAKKNGLTKAFDRALSALEKSVIEAEKAAKLSWRSDSRVTISGVAKSLEELGVTLRYNQLTKEAEVTGLPSCYSNENAANVLPVYLMDYMRGCGYEGVNQQTVDDCLSCIADRNRFNPVAEYLEGGTWDGQDRFPAIYDILGVTAENYQTYIRKWFMQCVALGLNSEDKPIGADGVLVLQGEQGLAKTSFFRIMSPFPRWFVEGAVIDMRDKDTLINSLGGWITELGELDSTIKKEQMSLKAFVTRPEDRIRAPYARTPTRAARRTSFCGTVNPEDYLRDETGSRRFWTIHVENIDKRALFSMPRGFVDQVWYQTYRMYQLNPNGFRLTDEEIKALQKDNQEFKTPLPYELDIRAMLDFSLPVEHWEWWRATDLQDRLPGGAESRSVGKALAKIAREFNGRSVYKDNFRRMSSGPEYLIPVQHYNRNWESEAL